MNIVVASLLLYGAVAVLGRLAWRRHDGSWQRALELALVQARLVAPRVFFAVLGAGFIAALVPPELVAAVVGGDTGTLGLLTASAIGAVTPGGPMLAFAVGGAALEVGGGTPQIIAFVTAWSLYNLNRTFVWEMPITGRAATLRRLAVALPLPVLLGFVAGEVARLAGMWH
ncbi:MAG: hypothetical protein Tsb0032_32620 [Kiloniellaceae bacterium]